MANFFIAAHALARLKNDSDQKKSMEEIIALSEEQNNPLIIVFALVLQRTKSQF